MAAALQGAQEIGFTVFSISVSLIAVFIPLLLMGGIIGRLFREFAITLSSAILVSMVVSLTTTPMMCSRVLMADKDIKHGRIYQLERARFRRRARWLSRAASTWVLDHPALMLVIFAITLGLNVFLIDENSQGIFPAAGYRRRADGAAGPAGQLVLCHAAGGAAVGEHHQVGSRQWRT